MLSFALKTRKKIAKIHVNINWQELGMAIGTMVLALALTFFCEYIGINLFVE